jgi:hypothetical protein
LHSQPASSRGLFNIFSRLYGRRSTEQSELLSLLNDLEANNPPCHKTQEIAEAAQDIELPASRKTQYC